MGTNLGITLVTADVWSFNDGARAFFRRQGFAQYIERLWSRQNPECSSADGGLTEDKHKLP
jgi:hypothetical protein